MLWPKKRPEGTAQAVPDAITPAELNVRFDEARFRAHMTTLLEVAQVDGGIETYIESLAAKQHLFGTLLGEDVIDDLGEAGIEALLEVVFTARRKLHPVFAELGTGETVAVLRGLLHGRDTLADRMSGFVAALPIRDAEGREARGRA